MDVPYTPIFVGLLLVYMGYSVWARLDGRYPIGAALALLVVTAVVDASGNVSAANTLAEFVFFLLGGGVVLLLIEHLREKPAADSSGGLRTEGVPSDSAKDRKGASEQSLEGLEQQTVSFVDGAGEQDREHEPEGDSHSEDRKQEPGNGGVDSPEDGADGKSGR